MKLPNGYGSVYKLSGTRRNPFIARKTKGWRIDEKTGKVKQLYDTIGFYPTRSDALQALANFNASPYDLQSNTITFAELYEKWADIHFKNIAASSRRSWVSAFNHCTEIHNMRFRDIRASHLEGVIRNGTDSDSIRSRMKSMFNQLYRFALKHEVCEKDYSKIMDNVKRPQPTIERVLFEPKEIETLFNNLDYPFCDMVLTAIYTGFRPLELCLITLDNVDLNARSIKGGIKTDAGTDRTVPIHSKILPLVTDCYNRATLAGSTHLFNDYFRNEPPQPLTYDRYRGRFRKVCSVILNKKHLGHDTRHTFITNAKRANVDEYALKMIVGHAIADVTEKVYTHRDFNFLISEIEKIK